MGGASSNHLSDAIADGICKDHTKLGWKEESQCQHAMSTAIYDASNSKSSLEDIVYEGMSRALVTERLKKDPKACHPLGEEACVQQGVEEMKQSSAFVPMVLHHI